MLSDMQVYEIECSGDENAVAALMELLEAHKKIAATQKALHCCCYTEPCARPETCGAHLSSIPMCCNCHPPGCMCEFAQC